MNSLQTDNISNFGRNFWNILTDFCKSGPDARNARPDAKK